MNCRVLAAGDGGVLACPFGGAPIAVTVDDGGVYAVGQLGTGAWSLMKFQK